MYGAESSPAIIPSTHPVEFREQSFFPGSIPLEPTMRCPSLRNLLAAGLLLVTPLQARSESIAFLVSELPSQVVHGDSYVITIDDNDATRLAQARAIAAWVAAGEPVKNEPMDRIIVTSIAAGANGINRDFLARGLPEWSWHPVGTPEFAGFTAEILDGWPTFVEEDVPGWIANTRGRLGFWSYTVTRELGPTSQIPEPASLTLLGTAFAGLLLLRSRR